MGIEELQIIAEIIGGLEQTGITGLLVYLGYGVLEMLLTAAVVLIVVWCAYKIINRLVVSSTDNQRLLEISGLLDLDFHGDLTITEWKSIKRRIKERNEMRLKAEAKYQESKERIKDYQGRLGQLTADYEALWQEHELAKATMDRQTSMIRQLDESINSAYDKPSVSSDTKEEDNGGAKDISNTGALSGRDDNVPE